jgi:translation initiation factor IF-1
MLELWPGSTRAIPAEWRQASVLLELLPAARRRDSIGWLQPEPLLDDGTSAGANRQAALMPKGDALEMDGTVIDTMRNSQFTVRLDNGHELLAYTGGKMRRFRIRILLGDRVRVEMSPYDLTRGRVSYRYR